MPVQKWLLHFKTTEVVNIAMKDPMLRRLPDGGGDRALDILRTHLVCLENNSTVQGDVTVSNNTIPVGIVVSPPPTQTSAITRPDVIITENGSFKSLNTLINNLSVMYPSQENLKYTLMDTALPSLSINPKVNYLGEPAYTNVIKEMVKILDQGRIELLGGDLTETTTTTTTTEENILDEGSITEKVEIETEEGTEDKAAPAEEIYPFSEYPFEVSYVVLGSLGLPDRGSDMESHPFKFKTYKEAQARQKKLNLDRTPEQAIVFVWKARKRTLVL